MKFWSVRKAQNKKGKTAATINIHGEIISEAPINFWTGEAIKGNYVCPDGFEEDLKKCDDADEINIDINSVGGDVYTAIAMHNKIASLKKNVNVFVTGVALSAASLIAMAGDTIQMYPGSIMMIHGVSSHLDERAYQEDAEKIVKWMNALNTAAASIYAVKTGKPVDEIRELMKSETWLNADEAVENGFATSVIEDAKSVSLFASKSGNMLFVNGIQMKFEGDIPKMIKRNEALDHSSLSNGKDTQPKHPEGKEKNHMTLEELKQNEPDLYNQIVKNARSEAQKEAQNSERARLSAIDEIASAIGDEKLVNEAKYGENPMTAEQLAFKAVQNAKNNGTAFLSQMIGSNASSGANDVGPAPACPENMTAEEKERLADQKKMERIFADMDKEAK